MLRFALFILFASACAGCKCHPVKIEATAKIKPEVPSVSTAGPVAPMQVEDHPCDCQCEECACVPKIAILDVDGVLLNADFTGIGSSGENPVALFRERLDAIRKDKLVKAVVLRINSPGGGVTASEIMWHDLRKFRDETNLPVVACIMDVGAGGAYYLASACDFIVAHPTSVTGGIGVILNVYNLSDALAQFNIVAAPVKAGDNIDIGTPNTALSDERRGILQAMANEFHGIFEREVLAARPDINSKRESTFDGRVFTASQALERNLIDDVGYLDDAVASAKELGCAQSARVVMYHRCNDRARSPYAITPNTPIHNSVFPVSMPGFDRARMPTFLFLWQPEPTLEKAAGR